MTRSADSLTPRQREVWRKWVAVNAQLPGVLNRELVTTTGLSLRDSDVLDRLMTMPGGRARVNELAHALQWERSRLSHHVTRMERRGLVEREDSPDDGRGAFIVLSAAGRAGAETSAPVREAIVKRLVFDSLQENELEAFSSFTDHVLNAMRQRGG